MKPTAISLLALAALLVCPHLLLAQDAPPKLPIDKVMTTEDQQATGVSKLTHKEREALESWLGTFALRAIAASQQKLAGAYAGVGGGHWIKRVIERGRMIQLEDGSLWELSPMSRIDAALWLGTESITVVESGSPLYPYKLVNTDSKSSAEAKLMSK